MKLYYWRDQTGLNNFGDDLNPWLWEKILPGVFDNRADTVFIGIGTILSVKHLPKAKTKIVFSSGTGYGIPPKIDDSWKIYCLRGPLSAERLGVSKDLAIADGALLLKKYYKPRGIKKHRISFMPHIRQAFDSGISLRNACDALGFHYIDPQWPVEKVLHSIDETKCLITEAMHGAIVADILRVPWIPIKTTDNICEFKWQDWCKSMKVHYMPKTVLPLWNLPPGARKVAKIRHWIKAQMVQKQLLKIAKKTRPVLSEPAVLNKRLAQLEEKCDQLKADIKAGMFN
jgi:succinoglycan biosynthesis protein ExoV